MAFIPAFPLIFTWPWYRNFDGLILVMDITPVVFLHSKPLGLDVTDDAHVTKVAREESRCLVCIKALRRSLVAAKKALIRKNPQTRFYPPPLR
jgi:hypothetical protein